MWGEKGPFSNGMAVRLLPLFLQLISDPTSALISLGPCVAPVTSHGAV